MLTAALAPHAPRRGRMARLLRLLRPVPPRALSQPDSRPRYRNDASTPGALSLPPTLARPPFTDIGRHALLAAAPELSGLPAELIRHGLRAKPPQMLAGIAALAPSHLPTSLPRSHLPAALSVPLRAPPGKGGERVAVHTIFPVQAVVLAAHYAKLPRLAPSAPGGSSRTASATLPVLPPTLPSPHAFAIFYAFMYTRRLAPALAALLPLPPAFLSSSSSHGHSGEELTHATLRATLAPPPALHALAAPLCASSSNSFSALMDHAAT
ncbi:hypothetical protein DFH09DRAFT_1314806 [Mycena vulgaris]|nr:hypothetical protein DFH09DRAFT_1314806 [Mycena vulgaris]